ncbi:MAG TPA: HIT family protein [Bryobacteraceae bacterium]|jgi:histidine triad (HIT) family protein|nr:HIT family protein [Bryobacteraceae bacterium]
MEMPVSGTCIFCKIVQRDAPGSLVYEDEAILAFLDLHPLFPGHVLVSPRGHYETLADLPGNLIEPLFSATQLLAKAVETAMQAEGTFVAVNNRVSQSVPHLHVHVVPRRRKDGLKGFFWPKHPYRDDAEREAIRVLIEQAVREIKARAS